MLNFKGYFTYISFTHFPLLNLKVFEIGCDILSILSPKQLFADAIAVQGALWRLLWVLERHDSNGNGDENISEQIDVLRKQRGWTLLEALSSSPSVAIKLVESTAWLELLGILVGYGQFTKSWIARTGAAKTISRLLWDPKTGSKLGKALAFGLLSTVNFTNIVLFSKPHFCNVSSR